MASIAAPEESPPARALAGMMLGPARYFGGDATARSSRSSSCGACCTARASRRCSSRRWDCSPAARLDAGDVAVGRAAGRRRRAGGRGLRLRGGADGLARLHAAGCWPRRGATRGGLAGVRARGRAGRAGRVAARPRARAAGARGAAAPPPRLRGRRALSRALGRVGGLRGRGRARRPLGGARAQLQSRRARRATASPRSSASASSPSCGCSPPTSPSARSAPSCSSRSTRSSRTRARCSASSACPAAPTRWRGRANSVFFETQNRPGGIGGADYAWHAPHPLPRRHRRSPAAAGLRVRGHRLRNPGGWAGLHRHRARRPTASPRSRRRRQRQVLAQGPGQGLDAAARQAQRRLLRSRRPADERAQGARRGCRRRAARSAA